VNVEPKNCYESFKHKCEASRMNTYCKHQRKVT